ncbi:hypothetical protein BMS3Bbin14_01071 [bacterium BMS3Bbin14]|nr:hypothetical protein BMS3Abin13_01875 [bacterium BMS3Abin13]GBE52597.1 hypothetical protein BMS3Bbin14_01071 [bacterium BMS3Bbin14]
MYPIYEKLELPGIEEELGTGWLPPLPDLRDYTEEMADLPEMAEKLGLSQKANPSFPASVDWRNYCSPVENQKNLGSCTAHAAVGVIEYFQRRAFGKYLDGSRLFVYKTTRNLMGVTGDTGAWLRNTMGALALCGIAPEKYWPYVVADFDNDPSAFVYASTFGLALTYRFLG